MSRRVRVKEETCLTDHKSLDLKLQKPFFLSLISLMRFTHSDTATHWHVFFNCTTHTKQAYYVIRQVLQ